MRKNGEKNYRIMKKMRILGFDVDVKAPCVWEGCEKMKAKCRIKLFVRRGIIQSWREASKFSVADVAKMAEITPTQWRNIESGRTLNPRMGTLQKMAWVIGVKLEYLIDFEEDA